VSANPGDAEVIRLRAIFEDLARADIEQLRRALGGLDRTSDHLGGTFRDTSGRLRTLDGRFASAGVRARVLESQLGSLRREAERTNRALGGMSDNSRGVRARTVLLGAAITALVSIIPGIVPLAGYLSAIGAAAVTAIPPAAAAIGTMALAFAGVGDAVSALASGDMDKINEAFRNLTPAGQAFAGVLIQLKPLLDGLRAAAQDGLLPGIGDALQTIAAGLGSTLETLVDTYATGLGELARQFSSSLVSPEAIQFFDYLIGKAQELDIFGKITTDTVAGIAQLIQALEPLSQVGVQILSGLASSFREFSSTVDFSAIAGYVQQTLPNVQRFFGAIGTTLGAIFQALAPVGPDVLDVLSEFLLTFASQGPAITSIFRVLLTVLEPVLQIISGPVLSLLGGLTTALQPLVERGGPALVRLFERLGGSLETVLPQVSDSLLGLLDAVLPVADSLLDELLPVVPIAADFLSQLVTALTPVIPLLGESLAGALQQLVPSLPGLVDNLVELASQLPALLPPLLDMITQLVPLLPVFVDAASSFLPILTQALIDMAPSADELAASLGVLAFVVGGVTKALQGYQAIFDLASGKSTGGSNGFGKAAANAGLNLIPGFGAIRGLGSLVGAGDTAGSHRRRGSMVGNTLAWTAAVAAGLGGLGISNLFTGGGGLGYGSGDHQAGAAVDLVGPNASRAAELANASGGFGEMHGSGAGRHAHIVPGNVDDLRRAPMGDTATSRMAPSYSYGDTSNVFQISGAQDPRAVAREVRRELGEIRRDLHERGSGSAF
jgi:phage-related protein